MPARLDRTLVAVASAEVATVSHFIRAAAEAQRDVKGSKLPSLSSRQSWILARLTRATMRRGSMRSPD
jgi:hypothetical protein